MYLIKREQSEMLLFSNDKLNKGMRMKTDKEIDFTHFSLKFVVEVNL